MQKIVRIAGWATFPLGLASLYGLAYLVGSYAGNKGVTKKDIVDLAAAVGTCLSAFLALAFALRQEFVKRQESLVVARITFHTMLSTLISLRDAILECAKDLKRVAGRQTLDYRSVSEIIDRLENLPRVTDEQLIAVTPLQYKCAAQIAQVQSGMVSMRNRLKPFGDIDDVYPMDSDLANMLDLVARTLKQSASDIDQALNVLKGNAGSEVTPVKLPPSVQQTVESINHANSEA
ncbi:hypothetical protein [Burkholderia orbicola]|uniref:hypothetical protein n=1 Tax=Burkholderia orbicola TaxID=2978683 RepID=UPI00265689A4|nr:hypothetical protein [Burkholderia orbicola]MDN7558843.1 hypothetical protein [Burkholderia orbicola]